MKPCANCPFLPSAPLGAWHPAEYLRVAYLGSVGSYADDADTNTVMNCHKSSRVCSGGRPVKPKVCGGWIRAAHDSFPLKIAAWIGRISRAERAEAVSDDVAVLSPVEMARANGLDVDRLPPLDWSIEVMDRYPTPQDWQRAISELRERVRLDPEYARTFVLPGSPLSSPLPVDSPVIGAIIRGRPVQRPE